MPRINLLPWRETQRREIKIRFLIGMIGATVVAALITLAGYVVFESMIGAQQNRNTRLRVEIKNLDKQIDEIKSLEAEKQQFIARMDIIQKLQRSRPAIVHVFDTIVKTLPEGVYLTGVKQKDTRLQFDGVAQSSTRVSTFMRNIDASGWLKNPELQVVQSSTGSSSGANFTLYAQETTVDQPDDQAKAKTPNAGARRGGK